MPDTPPTDRQRWMGVLARASAAELHDLLAPCAKLPRYTCLRGPELGLAMVRGRTGGGGAPFNMGEMTVSRCSVRTEAGLTGHAYVAGRDLAQAELAAVLDGALQDPARADAAGRRDRAAGPAAGAPRAHGGQGRGDPGAVLHHGDHARHEPDLPGFADPVADAQACFRAVLDAMAHPGRIQPGGACTRRRRCAAPRRRAADPGRRGHPALARPGADAALGLARLPLRRARRGPGAAAFAVCLALPALAACTAGSDDGPEDGATVILQLDALGAGPPFALSGPGLASRRPSGSGLPPTSRALGRQPRAVPARRRPDRCARATSWPRCRAAPAWRR